MPAATMMEASGVRRVVAVVSLAAILVGSGVWAGWGLAHDGRARPKGHARPPLVQATKGAVSAALDVPVKVSWTMVGTVRIGATGTITALRPDNLLVQGQAAVTVDLRPVITITGTTPMFRPLGEGMSGPDVGQLTSFLAESGHLRVRPTDRFTAPVTTAVKRWQRSIGLPDTGFVQVGDVVFVPRLPARIRLGTDVAVGSQVQGGSILDELVAPTPTFSMSVGSAVMDRFAVGQQVVVMGGSGHKWPAIAGPLQQPAPPQVSGPNASPSGASSGEGGPDPVSPLTTTDGGPLCRAECDILPVDVESILQAHLVVQPRVAGTVVPVAAIATGPGSTRQVVLRSGRRVSVELVGQARGRAVVRGIAPGTWLRLQQSSDR